MNKRAYLEIDLKQLSSNVLQIQNMIPRKTKILCVIKTDAYGHGAVPVAKQLEPLEGIAGFAVATTEEAIALREVGIVKTILILGYSFLEDYEQLIAHDITLTVFQQESIEHAIEVAQQLGTVCKVHLKVNTGMNRLGMAPYDESLHMLSKVAISPYLKVEGIFTHFACADEEDTTVTQEQYKNFIEFSNKVQSTLGLEHLERHISNSAGILTGYGVELDYVRAGIILYGIYPSKEVKLPRGMEPVLSLRSTLFHVREVAAKEGISYGLTYRTKECKVIATVPVGYGDGYPRDLSNRAHVLVKGQKAPIVGRICMDYFMIDVTNIEGVAQGDVVTLIGRDGTEQITIESLSEQSAHFYYEIPCCFTSRISRTYLE